MNTDNENLNIISPKSQTHLFGYEDYFKTFIKLYKKDRLPNTILLSGPKGSGKSTFVYHFINYIFSLNEENNYSMEKFTINPENNSFKLITNGTHPNFLLLESDEEREIIKVENVKKVANFLNKSTFASGIKVILIDNVEYLNTNAANALLKPLEENNPNTYFFILHNNSTKILNTIKSRCIEFKIFFNLNKKKEILKNIININNDNDININDVDDSFYFDSAGNIYKYMQFLKNFDIDIRKDKLLGINLLIEKYKKKSDSSLLKFIVFLIEIFFNELAIKNINNLSYYTESKFNTLKLIDNMKKFNLDKKSIFLSLKETLFNEQK